MSGSESSGKQFLDTIGSGYNVDGQSALAGLITSVVLTIVIAALFCFLRPYNSVVYAPRAKYADNKHAPPPVTKGLFGWIPPLLKTKEKDLVEKVGLDAAVFMRVCRMLRNIFSILAVICCGILIPSNLVGASKSGVSHVNFFTRLTPIYLYSAPSSLWAYVIVAWLMNIVIIYFLWANYRQVARLRREYFDSPDFQRSLHARTLMMTDIPKQFRSDEGIARIIDEVKVAQDHPRTAIARNVRDLPDLIEQYEEAVRQLEEHLAKYLKNPDRLPANRPTCKVHKNDKGYGSQAKGQKVDAIEYLTGRIKELEYQIKEVRQAVDRRDALSYGFASYESIPAAHSIAYAARNKTPNGAAIRLAPKPNDLVWKNLKMSRSQRRRQNFINSFWIALLTLAWTVPNLLIAVFLSNLQNLAKLWPGFNKNYIANPTWWAIVQGVLAPALTMAFYFYLPAIFRKLCIKAGDTTKSSRERHVARSLYSFFFLNNLLIFSLFSTVWTWVAGLIEGNSFAESEPLLNLLNGFCKVSTYWICWMLQRNLGAAVDLSQLFTLIWGSYSRRFLSPTPRSLIELSAPQAMDYAGYYNYFLFYATVAITFATIQPLMLPVTAFYFWMDSFMKKYLILYVFITKYESGGMFWRSIFNRMLFMTVFGNVIVALVIAANALQFIDVHWPKLAALVPLPIIVIGFKIYCRRTFDNEIHYYHMGRKMQDAEIHAGNELKKSSKGDRMAKRFGHPVLYKPLITPMVSSKSQHLLRDIYKGRTSMDDTATVAGYSDVYMDDMDTRKPGKGKHSNNEPFELVDEHNMDFENYKNRPEFRDEAGGDGELYGHAGDLVRPGTPSTAITGFSRAGTFDSSYSGHSRDDSGQSSLGHSRHHSRNISQQETAYMRSRSESRESERTKVGGDSENFYPRGYHQPTPSQLREESPAGRVRPASMLRHESGDMLVSGAAGMGSSTPAVLTPGGYGPVRYGTPDAGYGSDNDQISYDYIRRGRTYPNM